MSCKLRLSLFFSVASLLVEGTSASEVSSNWGKRAGGWHFYAPSPPTPDAKEKDKETPEEPAKAASAPPQTYQARLETWQKGFQEAKAKAIFEPTRENVASVQRLQRELTDKSLAFGKTWMDVSLSKGILTYPDANLSPQFLEVKKQEAQRLHAQNKQAAKDKGFGLFFLTKEGCPYCEKFAPTVRDFASQMGFEVLEVTNGASTGLFEAVPNNGIGDELNAEGIYPMLYLVDTKHKHFHPLSRGMSTNSQLMQNTDMVFEALRKEGVL